ncbi:transposase [Puniceicoccaceae bacterium K14]|nr:transposase [Puniceicoccaceae bacterium K14]
MPDHVHFFVKSLNAPKSLGQTIGLWKQWSSKHIKSKTNKMHFQWQPGFFDHVLRSEESYSEKWDYVANNPIRARLINKVDAWPYQGFIDFE